MKNDYDIAQMYREMELHLISSMQRNLGRHLKDEIAEGKEWKMWQAEKLKELKRYQRQNKDIVNFYTSGLSKDVSNILKEEFKQGHKSELNKYNKLFDKQISDSFFKLDDRKANVLINVVNNDLNEANKAVLRMMNDTYRQTVHKAATFASNGVMTQKQAVDMATNDFLSRGLNVIEYKDGKRVNIASYAQMAVRTASQRAMLMGEGEFRKSIGETNVIISKHGTACKLCVPHEGNVYIDDVYSGGKADGKHKLLSDAMKQGLFHPNCRHGISTYYGLDDEDEQETTVNVPEENNNNDAARLDREIQKADRKIVGSQDKDNILNAKLDKSKWVSRRDKLKVAETKETYRQYNLENSKSDNVDYRKLIADHRNNISEDIRKSIYKSDWDNNHADLNKYGYINSQHASRINYYLRNGNTGALSKSELKAYDKVINNLHTAINQNVINENVMVKRYVDFDWLSGKLEHKNYIGVRYNKKYDLLDELKGKTISENQFLSCSFDTNVYTERKIELNIKVNKGTNCFITENIMESEVIFKESDLLIENVVNKDDKVIITALLKNRG